MGTVPTLKNPSREDQLLFTCSRQRFLPAHRERLAQITHCQTIRWDEVYATAADHGVAPLIDLNLRQCPDIHAQVPAAVRDKFDQCTRGNVMIKALHSERIRGILEFFAL